MPNKPKPEDCRHNEGVACTTPGKCACCGWNPDVERARAEANSHKFRIKKE